MKQLAIGLMSGTSLDGMDAALVEISGFGLNTKINLLSFITYPYSREVKERLLRLSFGEEGGSKELCRMNFLLGNIMRDACLELIENAKVEKKDISFIASHGHTFYHEPFAVDYLGYKISSTLQLGEASVISEAFNCPVVSDFRVRDVAAFGQGAPLVPYTEYLLYRSEDETVALQNIGGIGNITCLEKGCEIDDVFAFDTGPGNMLIDSLMRYYTDSELSYDDGGKIAFSGKVSKKLLSILLKDPYLYEKLPKSTGREYYGDEYVAAILKESRELSLKMEDVISTVTAFTCESIKLGIDLFFKIRPSSLIVSGGGANNPFIMEYITSILKDVKVIKNEFADSKEAVAFVILANERLHNCCNNAINATGAKHPAVLGKVSL